MDDSTTPLFFATVKDQGCDPRHSNFLTHQQFMEKHASAPLNVIPMPKKGKGPKTAATIAAESKDEE